MREWTTDQQRVIAASAAENLLVSASAGSGKTSVMIERIASMVESGGVSLDEILVMTFTNESARDMKTKLRDRLGEKFQTTVGNVAIGTFHKFCIDLVKTYFNLVGINPAFGVLDEINANILQDQILDDMPPIDEFMTIYGNGEFKRVILSIAKFLEWQPSDWLEKNAFNGYGQDLCKNLAMKQIIEWYKTAGEYYLKQFTPDADCFIWATRLKDVKTYDDLHKIAMSFDKLKPMKKDHDSYDAKNNLNELLKKIRTQYKLTPQQIIKNQAADRELVGKVVESVKQFQLLYNAAKLERNFLDFSDLERYTIKILSDSQIRERVRQKYKHVFVDEYQDTNAVQEQILKLVAGDNNIFAVGDLKQSIYAFRGTSSEIFANRMKREKVIMLNENFRSNPSILSFVNCVFENIMQGYDKTSRFTIKGDCQDDCVETIVIEKGTDQYEAVIIANRILELKNNGVTFGDIAILARNGNHLDELVKTLSDAGIKCIVGKRQAAACFYEIELLNNFLQASHDLDYQLPVALIMQSFVFDFSPDDLAKIKLGKIDKDLKSRLDNFNAVLQKYNALCKTKNVVDVLTTFITEFNIIDKLLITPDGDVRVRNIYTLLNKLRGASFADTVDQYVYMLQQGQLDLDIDVSATGDCVKVMTIHASKGLEFPVVFLYNAGVAFSSADKRKRIMLDKNLGLCVYSTDPDENIKHMSIARLGSVIASDKASIAEEMRLLYVALTRAKDRLVIVGSGSVYERKTCGEFETWLCKSYLDFIRPTEIISADDVPVIKQNKDQFILGAKPDKQLVKQFVDAFERAENYSHPLAIDMSQKASVTSLTKSEEEFFDHLPKPSKFDKDRGTQYGTLFHTAMQRREPFDNATRRCMEIIDEFTKGMSVYRELVLLESQACDDLNDDHLLVQGVIDLLAVSKDRAIIIDYKTNKNITEAKLVALYKPQLEMYARAVTKALSLPTEIYIYSTAFEKLLKL